MRQIRHNIFETNSSSTHSIVLCKNDKLDIPDNEIRVARELVRNGRDEWEWVVVDKWPNAHDYDTYDSCELSDDKTTYFIRGDEFGWELFSCIGFDQKLAWWCSQDTALWEKDEIEDIIKEVYPTVVKIDYSCFDESYNYVDHQWRERCVDNIRSIGLKEFLTNDLYVILGGNDNEYGLLTKE